MGKFRQYNVGSVDTVMNVDKKPVVPVNNHDLD